MAICSILILQFNEVKRCLHLLTIYQFLSSKIWSSCHSGLSLAYLALHQDILCYIMLLNANENGILSLISFSPFFVYRTVQDWLLSLRSVRRQWVVSNLRFLYPDSTIVKKTSSEIEEQYMNSLSLPLFISLFLSLSISVSLCVCVWRAWNNYTDLKRFSGKWKVVDSYLAFRGPKQASGRFSKAVDIIVVLREGGAVSGGQEVIKVFSWQWAVSSLWSIEQFWLPV